MSDIQWFQNHDNIVILVRWMADHDYDADEIADAVETPWSYKDIFDEALAASSEDTDEDTTTYTIRRFYEHTKVTEVIKTGLTLDEAQAHCNDPATSGVLDSGERWFDGYDAES